MRQDQRLELQTESQKTGGSKSQERQSIEELPHTTASSKVLRLTIRKAMGFFKFYFCIIYLFLSALCVFRAAHGLSLVAASGGCSLVVACRLLIAQDSIVAEHGL